MLWLDMCTVFTKDKFVNCILEKSFPFTHALLDVTICFADFMIYISVYICVVYTPLL